MMQIARTGPLPESSDFDLIRTLLPIDAERLLELGCGAAETTRRVAESLPISEIVALEVDRIQHDKNLQITDLPNVRFGLGGAQAIDLPDGSVDAVMMLKSLHHVPVTEMDAAFDEIGRVLRPGGVAYISEPVYAGDFNDIMRLFHDEKQVRQAAFDATVRAIERGPLAFEQEFHFDTVTRFNGFTEFESRILGATHTEFAIDASMYQQIRTMFEAHLDDQGVAEFRNPMRVDLLRRPD